MTNKQISDVLEYLYQHNKRDLAAAVLDLMAEKQKVDRVVEIRTVPPVQHISISPAPRPFGPSWISGGGAIGGDIGRHDYQEYNGDIPGSVKTLCQTN